MALLGGTVRIGMVALLLAADRPELVPTAFRFELSAQPELHRLWEASLSAKAERVACLATCGPPSWRGTVHTHVALRDGRQPYSLFSGADRGIMMLWWRRWREDGIFCLLYSTEEVICEIEGPRGAVLFPRSRY